MKFDNRHFGIIIVVAVMLAIVAIAANNTSITSVTGAAPIAATTGSSPEISLTVCADSEIYKVNGTAWECATDAAGAGSLVTQANDVTVAATTDTLDFADTPFDVTESPANEANVSIDFTEIDDTTFGSGSTLTWTYDTGADDPTIQFSDNAVALTNANSRLDLDDGAGESPRIRFNNGNNINFDVYVLGTDVTRLQTSEAVDTEIELINTGAGNSNFTIEGGTFTISALDCTANTNGGALTTDATGLVSCSDDDSAAGTANILDLGDDASNESIDLIEIATTGDTNSIFTEPTADKLLIAVGTNWPTSDTADALTSNPTDCAADTKADAIAANGNLTCTAVDTGDITDGTILEADLNAIDAPSDGEVLTYDVGSLGFQWEPTSGGGDVTAVGPGCATGECFTDGVATTGSTLLVWEGTGVDTNEFTIAVPANPAVDQTFTFPDDNIADDDLIVGSGAGTFTYNALTDCDAANVNRLQYDTTTNAFSCDTDTFIDADVADTLTIGSASTITLNQGVAPTPTAEGRIEWETDDDHIIVGDGVGQVEFVPAEDVSGDATMTDAGVIEVTEADALEADPTDCAADTKADAIAANGNLTCTAVDTGDITDGTILEADLNAIDAPSDGEVLTYDVGSLGFQWEPTSGGGDVTAVGDCATGDCFTGASGTTLSSNTDLIFDLDEDNNGTETFQILDGLDALVAEVTEAGLVSALVGFDCIGNVDCDFGSADIDDMIFTTDGTGDGEITLPDDSVGPAEIDSTTGAYDFGGVTSFEIPNGTAPTVNAAGEIAEDTTANQLVYGASANVLDSRFQWDFTLENPSDADNFLKAKLQWGITITDVHCIVDPADTTESVVIDIQERNSTGDSPVTFDATITCDNDGAEDDGSLTNPTFDSGDWWSIDIGTVTGTVTQLVISVYGTITRE